MVQVASVEADGAVVVKGPREVNCTDIVGLVVGIVILLKSGSPVGCEKQKTGSRRSMGRSLFMLMGIIKCHNKISIRGSGPGKEINSCGCAVNHLN